MYCRMCGNQHGEEGNYCPNEGSMVMVSGDSVVLEQDNSKYCRGCGNENAQQNLYCQMCGHSLFTIVNKENVIKLSHEESSSKLGLGLHKAVLKTGIIGGVIASVLMLFAGWVGSLIISGMIEGMFHKQWQFGVQSLTDLYVNTSSTLLNYNLIGVTVEGKGEIGSTFHSDITIFLLLIIPFIILCGVGIWAGKQRVAKTIGEQIRVAVTVGMIYGLFLLVVSFIASKSVTWQEVETIVFGYPLFKSFVSGFIYGTLFSLFGLIVHTSQNNIADAFQELLPYGAALYYGMAAMVKGLLLTAVVLCVLVIGALSNERVKSFGNVEPTKSVAMLAALQSAPHIWGMAHFAPVEINVPVLQKEMSRVMPIGNKSMVELSAISGMSVGGVKMKDILISEGTSPSELEEFDAVNSKFNLILLFLVIPVFFMFMAGRKLAEIRAANMYIALAVCSGAYTMMMLIINILSKMEVHVSGRITRELGVGGTVFSMQNSWIYLILGSFILAYVAAFAGMKLVRK